MSMIGTPHGDNRPTGMSRTWVVVILLIAAVIVAVLAASSQKKSGNYLTLLSPEDGEELCIGDMHDITWDGSSNLTEVRVYLENEASGDDFELGVFSVDNDASELSEGSDATGMYSWQVGLTSDQWVPAGENYKIRLRGEYTEREDGQVVSHNPLHDVNEEFITLSDC